MVQSRHLQTEHHKWVFALIALVGVLSLIHAGGGAITVVRLLFRRADMVQQPFSIEFGMPVIRDPSDGAQGAGLERGDIVLSVNERPFTALLQIRDQMRSMRPGQSFRIEYIRPAAATRDWQTVEKSGLPVRMAVWPSVAMPPLTRWTTTLLLFFFFAPLFCLLTGLYVIAAKPYSLQAWCVFVVLAFPDCVFYAVILMPSALFAPALFWNHLIQALLPMAVLLFGVAFPGRSLLDRRAPWLKWALLGPLLSLIPYDFAMTYCYFYDFRLFPRLAVGFLLQARIGNVFSLLCAVYFVAALVVRYRGSTGDARRRLRILCVGSTVGLSSFFAFVLTSVLFNKSLNTVLPDWLYLLLLSTLLLFPLSLAYVVVVQRAMELRILIRQGTKHFFARTTLRVVLFLLAVWITWAVVRLIQHPSEHSAMDGLHIAILMALFFVLRFGLSKRIERAIDQRFFREAYSTEQILSELSDQARSFTEVEPLLKTVSQRIGAALHIDRIAVFVRKGESYALQYAMGEAIPSQAGDPLMLPASWNTIRNMDREPALVYRDDPRWLMQTEQAEQAALNDLSVELLVPLPGRNRLLGVMMLGPKRSEEPYSRTDRQLLQSVASQTGLALENAKLLEDLTAEITKRERMLTEIAVARDVQQRLFPQTYPEIAGVALAGACRPAQAVGGDYYDIFATEGGGREGEESGLGLAIGDISGKGISASLLMASLRASLRTAARMDTTPDQRDLTQLMRQVNRLVFESSAANRYATFFFAELDPKTRLLTYVNAGHNPPVILRGTETIPLPPTGLVVGLLEDAIFEQNTIELQPGDVLLAYTDGISEAMNTAEEEWGEETMLQIATKLINTPGCAWSAGSLVDCLFREADGFTAGAPQHDDMTVVVCAVL